MHQAPRPPRCPCAGRLRRLGRGKTLRFAGTADVSAKIAAVAAAAAAKAAGSGAAAAGPGNAGNAGTITSREVLQWVMGNTVAATLRGVLEWAHQGLHFAATKGAPGHALLPEVLGLAELYGAARRQQLLPDLVGAQRARRERAGLAPGMAALMGEVAQRGASLGEGHAVVAQAGLGEECEREVEREEEVGAGPGWWWAQALCCV